MPRLEFAKDALDRTAERVTALIEARKESFVQRSAAAGAILGLVLLVSPLKSLEPTKHEKTSDPSKTLLALTKFIEDLGEETLVCDFRKRALGHIFDLQTRTKDERTASELAWLKSFEFAAKDPTTLFDKEEEVSAVIAYLNAECATETTVSALKELEGKIRLVLESPLSEFELDEKSRKIIQAYRQRVLQEFDGFSIRVGVAVAPEVELPAGKGGEVPQPVPLDELANRIAGRVLKDGPVKLPTQLTLDGLEYDGATTPLSQLLEKLPERLLGKPIQLPAHLRLEHVIVGGPGTAGTEIAPDALTEELPANLLPEPLSLSARLHVENLVIAGAEQTSVPITTKGYGRKIQQLLPPLPLPAWITATDPAGDLAAIQWDLTQRANRGDRLALPSGLETDLEEEIASIQRSVFDHVGTNEFQPIKIPALVASVAIDGDLLDLLSGTGRLPLTVDWRNTVKHCKNKAAVFFEQGGRRISDASCVMLSPNVDVTEKRLSLPDDCTNQTSKQIIASLSQLGERLTRLAGGQSGANLPRYYWILGFTDAKGPARVNLDISNARAEAVRKALGFAPNDGDGTVSHSGEGEFDNGLGLTDAYPTNDPASRVVYVFDCGANGKLSPED